MLDAFLDERERELAPLGPDAGRLTAEARTAVSGGKRFRAAFCHWGYRAIRPEVTDAAALAHAQVPSVRHAQQPTEPPGAVGPLSTVQSVRR